MQQLTGAAQVGATGAQQLGATGAQHFGAGAQHEGAGAQQLLQHFFLNKHSLGIFHLQHLGLQQSLQQLGAGAQHVGAGAQQPWSASNSVALAQQNRMAAVKVVHFIMSLS